MKKILILAIGILAGIILLSLVSLNLLEDFDKSGEISENNRTEVPKLEGRNLSVELDEKMGFLAP